ncbi:hypothetical protein DID77_04375, partial [Candidatus Marinamargulisbacteria bacterium SCGC AG-439-L15]
IKRSFSRIINALNKKSYDFSKDEGYREYYENGQVKTHDSLAYRAIVMNAWTVIDRLIKQGYDFSKDEGYREYNEDRKLTDHLPLVYSAIQHSAWTVIDRLIKQGYDFSKPIEYQESIYGGYKIESLAFEATEAGEPAWIKGLQKCGYDFSNDGGYREYDQNGVIQQQVTFSYGAFFNGYTNVIAAIHKLKDSGYDFSKDMVYREYAKDGSYSESSPACKAGLNGWSGPYEGHIQFLQERNYSFLEDCGHKIYTRDGKLYSHISLGSLAVMKGRCDMINDLCQAGYCFPEDGGYTHYHKDGQTVHTHMYLLDIALVNNQPDVIAMLHKMKWGLSKGDVHRENYKNGLLKETVSVAFMPDGTIDPVLRANLSKLTDVYSNVKGIGKFDEAGNLIQTPSLVLRKDEIAIDIPEFPAPLQELPTPIFRPFQTPLYNQAFMGALLSAVGYLAVQFYFEYSKAEDK